MDKLLISVVLCTAVIIASKTKTYMVSLATGFTISFTSFAKILVSSATLIRDGAQSSTAAKTSISESETKTLQTAKIVSLQFAVRADLWLTPGLVSAQTPSISLQNATKQGRSRIALAAKRR